MKDIKYKENNYQFHYRTSAIIYNKDKTKILFFKSSNRDFYMLPGGKVNELESSEDALKREVQEETGLEINIIDFKCFSECVVTDKEMTYQQVEAIYEASYNDEINNDEFNGLEGNWILFKWFNINNLDNILIEPKGIKDILKNNKNHIVDGF
jgi:ADP-ribose pyrophosphatase YjhB (NUDIX family)